MSNGPLLLVLHALRVYAQQFAQQFRRHPHRGSDPWRGPIFSTALTTLRTMGGSPSAIFRWPCRPELLFNPLPVVPIEMRYGWRASFYVFALVVVVWAVVWVL